MNDVPRYSSLRDYLRVLREQRLLILAAIVLVAGAAVAYALQQDKSYRAEATLEVRDELADFELLGTPAQRRDTPQVEAAVMARGVSQAAVVHDAQQRLKSGAHVTSGSVSASVEASSSLVVIQATAHHALDAAEIANAFAEAATHKETVDLRSRYARAARDAQKLLASMPKKTDQDKGARAIQGQVITRLRQLAGLARPVEIVTRAAVPHKAYSPRPVLSGVVGGLLGLVLGLLLAFGRDSLDRRFRSSSELRDELDLPLLGWIGDDLMGRTIVGRGRTKALSGDDLETFRILRTNLDFLDVDAEIRAIAVTSAVAEEGKSTAAAALAAVYARAGQSVLLVECDLRRPVVAERLGLRAGPGLSEYLAGHASPEEILQAVALPEDADGEAAQLLVITAGRQTPRPAELLGSQRFGAFVAEVREAYEVVILDCPPVLSVADALEVVPHSDAVLLCVRTTSTTRDQARAARSAMGRLPARPSGLVVTGVSESEGLRYGYYSYASTYGAKT